MLVPMFLPLEAKEKQANNNLVQLGELFNMDGIIL
jgi:hypothetical protein